MEHGTKGAAEQRGPLVRLDHGRRRLVTQLVAVAFQAGRMLVHGPWGIGKTTILTEAARTAREAGFRVGYFARTESLADVVRALEAAYPIAAAGSMPARQRRSSLRLAVEQDPGLLVLDSLDANGTALVGILRSLRGKKLAVLAAAEVEDAVDLAIARSSGLAYRELAVPRLGGRDLGKWLELLNRKFPLPFHLNVTARGALLDLADGRPGVLERAWARLRANRYWRGSVPLLETVAADVRLEWLSETRKPATPGRVN